MAVFVALSFVFFCTGLMSIISAQHSITIFVALLAVSPLSNPYHDFVTFNGVQVYDFYFLGLGMFFLFADKYKINQYAILLVVSAITYLLLSSLSFIVDGGKLGKSFLLDFRPYIALLESILFMVFVRAERRVYAIGKFVLIIIIAGIFSIIWFVVLKSGLTGMEDPYYTKGFVRYFSAATYISLGYLLAWSYGLFDEYRNRSILLVSVISALFIIFLSGYRIIIFTGLLTITINYFIRRKFFPLIVTSLFFVLLVGLFYLVYDALEVRRVSEATNIDVIILQLITRYSPAIDVIREMSITELIFGKGMGFLFEIPWFEYRGLETDAISMDSYWLTMYVKNGLLSVFWAFAFIGVINHRKVVYIGRLYLLFFVILGLTMSLLYQPVFVGLFVMGILISEMLYTKTVFLVTDGTRIVPEGAIER